ncbi:hypothetical protein DINM_005985 [Dirofilaria immitis]|nr:hypothetical protein [Dirofilaria immitis]
MLSFVFDFTRARGYVLYFTVRCQRGYVLYLTVRCKLKLTPLSMSRTPILTKPYSLQPQLYWDSQLTKEESSDHQTIIEDVHRRSRVLSKFEKHETEEKCGDCGEMSYPRQVCHDQKEIIDSLHVNASTIYNTLI